MKLLQQFLLAIFLSLHLSSFTGNLEQTNSYATWSIKVNRDCYLVLNDVDWGELKKDYYIEIALLKGMNSLKFTKNKGGETIKKEIIVVDNIEKKELDIVLPGEVIIHTAESDKEKTKKRNRRVVSMCSDYKEKLRLKATDIAVVAICVNAEGYVETAEFVRSKSDSLSQQTIDLVLKCVKAFQYEALPGAPTSCGNVTLHLGIH